MTTLIHVVTVRPTHFRGRRVEPGTHMQLELADAHALVTNHKAQLCNPDDMGSVNAAVQRADLAAATGSPGFIPPVLRPY